jgi:hypothetical protein
VSDYYSDLHAFCQAVMALEAMRSRQQGLWSPGEQERIEQELAEAIRRLAKELWGK